MGKNKARLILLNKSDLSDPAANRAWTAYFESLGFAVLEINARSGAGMKAIQGKVQEACREKIERDRRRGIFEPSGACDGGRNSKRRKIDVYQ